MFLKERQKGTQCKMAYTEIGSWSMNETIKIACRENGKSNQPYNFKFNIFIPFNSDKHYTSSSNNIINNK